MNVAQLLDPAAYAAIERLGRSALAWEVLRRDPGYRDAYLALVPTLSRGSVSNPTFSVRWGMHFP